ncbi:MAG: tRNA preQ1(34) S-adenosylmethionine ribosyltransferase-isomerase QueA [Pseudomonadota bacterium]
MRLEEFDYELPEDLIALRPIEPRCLAKLLVATPQTLSDQTIGDLPSVLRPDDLLVFNNTKVIPAQLVGKRSREGSTVKVDATLIERVEPDCWRCLARPGKRLSVGDQISFGSLVADVATKDQEGVVTLRFNLAGPALDAEINSVGAMPLPPYIARRRAADAQDRRDYQTVFAEKEGAVAAPTAALHFDEALVSALDDRGIERATVTLHVGAGTFLPVKVDEISEHKMHSEVGQITAETAARLNRAREQGRRIIAVGTTALRVLETAAGDDRRFSDWAGATDIFITPGYEFRGIDGLMTNFHLPKSTLLMLVSALMGVERMREVYGHAISKRYRFFSYGDSSLLLP